MRTIGKSKREPTRETEAIIQRYYKAFNAGDAQAMLACLAEDVRHDVN